MCNKASRPIPETISDLNDCGLKLTSTWVPQRACHIAFAPICLYDFRFNFQLFVLEEFTKALALLCTCFLVLMGVLGGHGP